LYGKSRAIPTLRAAVGSVIYLVLIFQLALGVATTVRDTGVSIGVVLILLDLPRRFAQAGPGLEHTLGSGLQIAQDGEDPSVVSV
jgi:hypothetical protein